MKKKTSKKITACVIGAVVILALVVLLKPKAANPLDSVAKDVFAVRPETVQKRDLRHQLIMSGSVKAWEEATLYPRVSGAGVSGSAEFRLGRKIVFCDCPTLR